MLAPPENSAPLPPPCSVVYRRHLADDADLEHSEADEMARRWPVAWLILRPAKYGPRHQLPTQVGKAAMAARVLQVGCWYVVPPCTLALGLIPTHVALVFACC